MARVFITGSSDGLGFMAAQTLLEQGHEVVLHARKASRAEDARIASPQPLGVVVGDFCSVAEIRDVASHANAIGPFDAVIHNAGIGYREKRRIETEDGLSHLFSVNVLAPYVLTALMHRPKRLVYLSSGMHRGASNVLDDVCWERRRWNGSSAYAETKLLDVLLAFAVAGRWPDVFSNALEPGWVPTKMGGRDAPDDLNQAHLTQVWLAVSSDAEARVTGQYFYHLRRCDVNPAARNVEYQNRLLDVCAELSGVEFPAG